MDKIKHHLTDDLLMGYSTGVLPEAFSLVVATHLSLCDECRARAGQFDAMGGCVLEEEVAELSSGALEATMSLIGDTSKEQIVAQPKTSSGVFPVPLQNYVGGDLDSVKWRGIGLGVRQAILSSSKGATVRLLHIPAGKAIPDHSHRGTELTLVLKGAFRDEEDRFARGDVEIANEHLHHTPVAEAGEDCICLAATDAPLKFRGLMPRVAQSFLRI